MECVSHFQCGKQRFLLQLPRLRVIVHEDLLCELHVGQNLEEVGSSRELLLFGDENVLHQLRRRDLQKKYWVQRGFVVDGGRKGFI